MVKKCTFLDGFQWLESKNNVGFDQYFSIEMNKVGTIYCGTPFSFQTFDILRLSLSQQTCDMQCGDLNFNGNLTDQKLVISCHTSNLNQH